MLEILQYPFMVRALIAGGILGIILTYLGVFVVLKKMAFFSDGIAHASLAGVAIGIIFSLNPTATAIIFSAIFALLIYFLEEKLKLSSDVTIGIIFTAGLSLGILLVSLTPGYQPELITFLFGNILSITKTEIVTILIFSVIIVATIKTLFKQITFMALNSELAYANNIKIKYLQPLLYVILAVAIVLSIKILGIILVSALLILPIATAKIKAKSLRQLTVEGIIWSEIFIITGLIISYYFDLPSGPTIVLTGSALFGLQALFSKIRA